MRATTTTGARTSGPQGRRRRSLSVQSVQERWPWLLRPVEVLDGLATPRRWLCALCPGSPTRHTTRVDTTRAGAVASELLGRLSPLRARLLDASPAFTRLEWELRKLTWSLVWAATVAYRLRPKRPPVPRDEKRIRLISAPTSYGDFHADLLVVPDDVPCGEASLMGDVLVQLIHLLQDVFPVAASHQPVSSFDPDQRLAHAWSPVYRFVREPPRWHPELAAAARQGNLLGALAAGGPFAKLLERAEPGSPHPYKIDLTHMAGYPVHPGLSRLGCRINLDAPGSRLWVADVVYDGDTVAPGEARWEHVERIALCSLVTHLTVWRHGMQYHVAGLAPVTVATHNLPARHPLRRLLAAHVAETLSTNYYTHLTLRRNGFDVTGFSFPREVIYRYYDDGARAFNLGRLDVGADAERRGIPADLDYPYLPLARRYYDLIGGYVTAYVDHYYPDDDALAGDADAQEWFEALDRDFLGGIRSFVPSLTKAGLVRFCTLFIHAVTVEHEQNSLWDYSVFLPTTVREDGVAQSVGEVQSVLNFELLTCSATNRLMNDMTHLALDQGAAAIMAELREALGKLQAELEGGDDHYWVVYPADLEASVSA